MSGAEYQNMGPSIDLGTPPEEEPYRSPGKGPRPPAGTPSSGGFSWLALISLLISLGALGMALWGLMAAPEPLPPNPSQEAAAGATVERVAKLEKDVGQLILRMVTLEKELQAVGNKAGSITKLSELSASVAALQERLDAAALNSRLNALENKRSEPDQATPAPAKPQVQAPQPPAPQPKAQAPPAKPEPGASPAKKQQVYTVKRGDTLYTVSVRYKVRMADILKWNKMKKGDVLKVGQKLVLYK